MNNATKSFILTDAQLEDLIDSLDDRIERLKVLETEVNDPADTYFRETITDLGNIRRLLRAALSA